MFEIGLRLVDVDAREGPIEPGMDRVGEDCGRLVRVEAERERLADARVLAVESTAPRGGEPQAGDVKPEPRGLAAEGLNRRDGRASVLLHGRGDRVGDLAEDLGQEREVEAEREERHADGPEVPGGLLHPVVAAVGVGCRRRQGRKHSGDRPHELAGWEVVVLLRHDSLHSLLEKSPGRRREGSEVLFGQVISPAGRRPG